MYADICLYITTLYNVDMLIIRCEKNPLKKSTPMDLFNLWGTISGGYVEKQGHGILVEKYRYTHCQKQGHLRVIFPY